MRVAKATTKDGRAVGDVPEDGAQVWALTRTGDAEGGYFFQKGKMGEVVNDAYLMTGGGALYWADIVTWAAAPKLTTKDNGDLIMADLPF